MTDIVIVPAAPVVPPFPALGAPDFNQAAYTFGVAMPGVSDGVKALADTARTNATVASEKAAAAVATASQAVTDTNAIKTAAVSETNAIKTAAVSETTAIRNDAVSLTDASKNAAALSASNALASEGAAHDSELASAVSAGQSEASRIAASKLNLGAKAAPPALDNQGAALTAGTTYYDTTLDKWRVWTGTAWGEGVSAVAGVSSINGLTGDVVLPPPQFVAYTDRANLRSQTPASGELAIVDGLGLFVFTPASTEPDDDESCFATASGRWLLQAAHWDLVDAWQLPEVEERDAYDEDEGLRFASSFASSFPASFASSFASKVLAGSATCAITSVASTTSVSFTGTVTGAAVGDRVIAAPPAELGATAAETGRLGYHAWVSAANTVTIMLTNASAAAANTNAAIRAAWPITVIKS